MPSKPFNGAMNGQFENNTKSPDAFGSTRQMNRHSMEASLAAYSNPNFFGQTETSRPTLASIHPSYSTNDVPTLKNAQASSIDVTPPKTHAQQHFHNHNASLGRIPSSAINIRHSRELSGGETRRDEIPYQQLSSALQASAAPFGPPSAATSPVEQTPSQNVPFANAMNFQGHPYYGNYNVQMMNIGMNPMPQMTNPLNFQNQIQMFQPPQNGFTQYPNIYAQQARFPESQSRVMQQRRAPSGDGELYPTEFRAVTRANSWHRTSPLPKCSA